MDLVNLAYNGHPSPTEMSFGDVIVSALFPVLFIVVVIGLPIYGVMSARRARQGPKFDGPALTGTAQVLSVQPRISTANWGLMGSGGAMCRIGLIVESPDIHRTT
jgi:hypothetical protein